MVVRAIEAGDTGSSAMTMAGSMRRAHVTLSCAAAHRLTARWAQHCEVAQAHGGQQLAGNDLRALHSCCREPTEAARCRGPSARRAVPPGDAPRLLLRRRESLLVTQRVQVRAVQPHVSCRRREDAGEHVRQGFFPLPECSETRSLAFQADTSGWTAEGFRGLGRILRVLLPDDHVIPSLRARLASIVTYRSQLSTRRRGRREAYRRERGQREQRQSRQRRDEESSRLWRTSPEKDEE